MHVKSIAADLVASQALCFRPFAAVHYLFAFALGFFGFC